MQVLVQIRIVYRQNTAALPHFVLEHAGLVHRNALRDVAEFFRGEGLILGAHREHESVIWDNLTVVEDHILVRPINIRHARVNDFYASLEHQFLELLERVTSRVGLQIAILVETVMMRQATW